MDSFDQLIIQVEDSGMKTSNALVFLSLLWVHLTAASSHERTLSASVDSSNAAATLGQKVAFLAYTAKYGKNYASTSEFNSRFQQWVQTDNNIKSSNNSQSVLSHNEFSDQFESEKNGNLNSKLGQATVTSASLAQQSTTAATATCPAGQYNVPGSSICKACPAGCATCSSATVCTACNSAKFQLNKITNLCVCTTGPIKADGSDCNVCAQNQYYDQSLPTACQNCNAKIAQCTTCISATQCTTCGFGYVQQSGTCVCPNLFTYTATSGLPTGNNSFIDINKNCVSCQSNQFFNLNTNPATDVNALKCTNCPQNCTTCQFVPSTSATKVAFRSVPVAGLPTNCNYCADTYILNTTTGGCQCPANSYVDPVTSKCITLMQCPQKYYNLNNTCKPCGTYCLQCAPQTGICTKCQSNLEVVTDTNKACPACDPQFMFIQPGQCRCKTGQFIDATGQCVDKKACNVPIAKANLGGPPTLPYVKEFNTGGLTYYGADGKPSVLPNTCALCSLVTNKYCQTCEDTTGRCLTALDPSFLLDALNNFAPYCDPKTKVNTDLVVATNKLALDYVPKCIDLITCPKTAAGVAQYNDGFNVCLPCPFGADSCTFKTGITNSCAATFTTTTNADGSITCSCLNSKDVNLEFYNPANNQCVKITPCSINKYNDGKNNCLTHPDEFCDVATKLWNQDPTTGGVCTKCMQTFDFWGGSTCRCNPNPQIQFIGPNTINSIVGQPKQCINIIACNATAWNDGYNNCNNCSASTADLTQYCNKCAFGTGKCSGCQTNFVFNGAVTPATCSKVGNSYISYDPWAQNRDKSLDFWASCASGCTNCNDGNGDCSSCINNLNLIQNDDRSVTCGCFDGTYLDSATMQCRDCPANCTTCNSDQQCTSCSGYRNDNGVITSGFTLFSDGTCGCDVNSVWIEGQCQPLQSCGTGYFADLNNECQVCPIQYCYDCAPVTGQCLTCQPSAVLDMQPSADGMSCSCPAGTFLDLTFGSDSPMCTPCWWSSGDNMSNCYTCDDDRTCTSCLGVGFNLNNGCQCDSGNWMTPEYLPGTTYFATTSAFGDNKQIYDCIPCPANCTTCDQLTGRCLTCQDSFLLDTENGVCNCGDDGQTPSAAIVNGMCSQWQDCTQLPNYNYPSTIFFNDGANNCIKCPKYACKCDDFTGLVGSTDANYGNNNCMGKGISKGMLWDSVANTCGCGSESYLVKTSVNQCPSAPTVAGQSFYTCAECPANSTTCSDYTGYAQTCLPGFANVGGQCICNTGPVGRMFFTAGAGEAPNTCVPIKKCPLGYSNDGVTNTCVKCGQFCMKCKDYTGECTVCNNTFQFVATQTPRFDCECPKGKYSQNQGPCQPCAQNCTACKQDYNGFGCTECLFSNTPTAYADFYKNQTCRCHPQEQAVVAAGCVPLLTNCGPNSNNDFFYDEGHNICTECPGAWVKNCNQYLGQTIDGGCQANFTQTGTAVGNYQCNCKVGEYKTYAAGSLNRKYDAICMKCADNCTSCDDWTGNCRTCKNTFALGVYDPVRCACPFATPALNADGFCHPLFDGCTKVPNGWYDDTNYFTGAANQLPLQGAYDPWNNVCVDCPRYATKCVNQTISNVNTVTVLQCSSVTFWQKKTECACGPQHFIAAERCQQCPKNCASCSNANTCTSCIETFTLGAQTAGKCDCLNGASNKQALQDGRCQVWQTCSAGFYNPGNNLCKACPANCATCADGTGICSACVVSDKTKAANALPFTLNIADNTCTCTGSSYDNTKQLCLTCPRNCLSCNYGTGTCITCATGFERQQDGTCECARNQYKTQGACGDATVCKAGTYNLGNNVCQQCPGNCTTCTNLTGSCTSCVDSSIYKFKLLTLTSGLVGCIPQNCPLGAYPDSQGVCQTCPANCTKCDDITGSCSTCASTFTLQNIGKQQTCGCNDNQNLINGACVNFKTDCKIGQYADRQNNCQKCPQNCTTCKAPFGKCDTCAYSFNLDNQDNGVCACNNTQSLIVKDGINQCVPLGKCQYGFYNLGNDQCAKCSAYCVFCRPFTGDCQQCANGATLDLNTKTCIAGPKRLLNPSNHSGR